MRLPDLVAYQAAVQHPSTAFADPDLRAGSIATGPLGLPRAVAGNFAVTYQLQHGARRWAVRCFHRDVADRAPRYAAISRTLAGIKSQALENVTYLDRGVSVGQAWYPITKMAWLDGQPLNRAIEDRLSYPALLGDLERRFIDLVSELRRLGIAHGDLQHGNVLVDRSGQLHLVDYDGMFVPALKGLAASESGDPNYQHPRRATQFDRELDRFAAIVIVVALRALAAAPRLWRTYNTDDNLLFRRADFANPASSPLFRDLLALPAMHELASRLAEVCRDDYAAVPLLDDVFEPPRAPVLLLNPAHAAVLNRLFGPAEAPKRQRRRTGQTRSGAWKVRRAVAQQAVAFSHDGKLVATADAEAHFWVRDALTGRTRQTLRLPRLAGRVGALGFGPGGSVVAAAIHGSSISVWDVTDGRWTREFTLRDGDVTAVAFSSHGRHLAAAGADGSIRCWVVSSGSLVGVCRATGRVRGLAVSGDGKRVASAGAEAGAQVWELPAGQTDAKLPCGAGVQRVAFWGDAYVATIAHDGRLGVWPLDATAPLTRMQLQVVKLSGLALAPDGSRVAIVSLDGSTAVRALSIQRTSEQRPATVWLRDLLRRVATAVP
jgi:hypothetical protein